MVTTCMVNGRHEHLCKWLHQGNKFVGEIEDGSACACARAMRAPRVSVRRRRPICSERHRPLFHSIYIGTVSRMQSRVARGHHACACAHQPGVGPSADWSPEHRPQPHSISDIEDGGSLPCLPGRPGFIGRFDLQCRGCPACQSARLTNCLTVAVVKWVHGAMHA